MRWEWDVDGQIVSAQLNVFTGRETIVVDRRPVFDKINWKPRNEVLLIYETGARRRYWSPLGGGSPLGAF